MKLNIANELYRTGYRISKTPSRVIASLIAENLLLMGLKPIQAFQNGIHQRDDIDAAIMWRETLV